MPSNLRAFTVLVALFVGAVFSVTLGIITDSPSSPPSPPAHDAQPSLAPTDDPLSSATLTLPEPLPAIPALHDTTLTTASLSPAHINNPPKNLTITSANPTPTPALTPALTPAPSSDAARTVQVIDSAAAHSIQDREPDQIATAFDADVGQVWAWVRVANSDAAATHVTFVWRHGDRERARVELPVGARAKSWRTWSSKRIMPHQAGPWSVDILDAHGALLNTLHFHVGSPTQTRTDG